MSRLSACSITSGVRGGGVVQMAHGRLLLPEPHLQPLRQPIRAQTADILFQPLLGPWGQQLHPPCLAQKYRRLFGLSHQSFEQGQLFLHPAHRLGVPVRLTQVR